MTIAAILALALPVRTPTSYIARNQNNERLFRQDEAGNRSCS